MAVFQGAEEVKLTVVTLCYPLDTCHYPSSQLAVLPQMSCFLADPLN